MHPSFDHSMEDHSHGGASSLMSSTSTTYSHLSHGTSSFINSTAMSSRHLGDTSSFDSPSSFAPSQHRSSHHANMLSPTQSELGSACPSTNLLSSRSLQSHRSHSPSSPSVPHSSIAQSQPFTPFVPTIDFDQLERRPSPMHSVMHDDLLALPVSIMSNMNNTSTFKPDFLSAKIMPFDEADVIPGGKQDAMDELMDASIPPSATHHASCVVPTTPARSPIRLSCSGAVEPSLTNGTPPLLPNLLSRSRFAHLGASTVPSANSPALGQQKRLGSPRHSGTAEIPDDSFTMAPPALSAQYDGSPRASVGSIDSSPIQVVRRLGGMKQAQTSRRTTLTPSGAHSTLAAANPNEQQSPSPMILPRQSSLSTSTSSASYHAQMKYSSHSRGSTGSSGSGSGSGGSGTSVGSPLLALGGQSPSLGMRLLSIGHQQQ